MSGPMEVINTALSNAIKYKNEAKSLWDELETSEGDKTFYQKFGVKVTSTPGIRESIQAKMASVAVHFSQVEVPEPEKGRTEKQQQNQQTSRLAMLVDNMQTLVRDHGYALENIRELLVQQEATNTKVQEKLDEPGPRDSRWMEDTIEAKVREATTLATREVVAKMEQLEEKVGRLEGENKRLKRENKELAEEVDETRQRGMKGNLIISCPPRVNQPNPAIPQEVVVDGVRRKESMTEVCLRLQKSTSGATIPVEDVVACHRLPENNHTWILRVGNRAPGSGWEALAAGMLTGRRHGGGPTDWFTNNGVYLRFQLTEARAKVHTQVRLARKAGLLHKFSTNQNGRITILKERSPRSDRDPKAKEAWIPIGSLSDLEREFPNQAWPLPTPARRART